MKNVQRLFAVGLLAVGSVGLAHQDESRAVKDRVSSHAPAHESAHGSSHAGHASALGRPGDPKKVSRTVRITMSDAMRFTPASISIGKNETVRFVLKNEGKLKHEMVLGTIEELKEHAALMRKFPEMEHADPNQASVDAGKTGALVWQFTKAGTFDFACLQAGHYEAGMKGRVVVAGATTTAKSGRPADRKH